MSSGLWSSIRSGRSKFWKLLDQPVLIFWLDRSSQPYQVNVSRKVASTSVAVSKTGKTAAHFIDKGTMLDGHYYHENLLQDCLLKDIRQKSRSDYVSQQDGALSHRMKSTSRVSAAERSQLHRAFYLATKQSRPESCWLCCLRHSTASYVQSSNCGFEWSQGQSVHLVAKLLETNPHVCCLMVDFSKAFDSINHPILASKPDKLHLQDHICNWIINFLTDRTQSVVLNGKVSNK